MQCRHREAARSNDEAGVCMPRHSGTGQTVRPSLATNHTGQIRTAKENVGRGATSLPTLILSIHRSGSFRLSFRIVPVIVPHRSIDVGLVTLSVPLLVSISNLLVPLLVTSVPLLMTTMYLLVTFHISPTLTCDYWGRIETTILNQSSFFSSSISGRVSFSISGISLVVVYVATPIGLS